MALGPYMQGPGGRNLSPRLKTGPLNHGLEVLTRNLASAPRGPLIQDTRLLRNSMLFLTQQSQPASSAGL